MQASHRLQGCYSATIKSRYLLNGRRYSCIKVAVRNSFFIKVIAVTMTPPNVRQKNSASRSAPLQSIGLLCALIFVINYTYELLDIHSLYQSQRFLISLLLWVLSGWALLVAVILARAKLVPVTHLSIALCVQLIVGLMRHGLHFSGPDQVTGSLPLSGTWEIGMTLVYGPIDLVSERKVFSL